MLGVGYRVILCSVAGERLEDDLTSKYRGGWLVAILVAGAAIVRAIRLPTELMLTARAKVAIPGAQFGFGDYQWLSNSQLLIERDAQDSRFSAGLFRWNLASGTLKNEAALRVLLPRANGETLRVSPDGAWLLSGEVQDRRWNDFGHHCYYVCRADGTRPKRRAAGNGFMLTRWLADSRHWVELYVNEIAPNSAPNGRIMQIQRIKICDVSQPDQSRSMNITPSSPLNLPRVASCSFAGGENRILACTQTSYEPNTQIVVYEFSLIPSAPLRLYRIRSPGRRRVIQILFNARGDRMLWKLLERRQPGIINQVLHRLMPSFNAYGVDRVSLWVSRIDGSDIHEVGGVNNPGLRLGTVESLSGPTDPETGEYEWGAPVPHKIRWAPDGRRIGFVYKSAIWTAAVE